MRFAESGAVNGNPTIEPTHRYLPNGERRAAVLARPAPVAPQPLRRMIRCGRRAWSVASAPPVDGWVLEIGPYDD